MKYKFCLFKVTCDEISPKQGVSIGEYQDETLARNALMEKQKGLNASQVLILIDSENKVLEVCKK